MKPLGVEPALVQGLPRELLVRLELQRLVVPGLLPLVAWRELESLVFEPALELEPPLFLRLLVVLQEQLVLSLELQLVELLRPGQKRMLKLLGFEAALALELGLLKLVALRELEPIEFEPELALELLPLVAFRG